MPRMMAARSAHTALLCFHVPSEASADHAQPRRTLLLSTQSLSGSFHAGLASSSAAVSLPVNDSGSSSAKYSASDTLPSLLVSEYRKSCRVRRLVAFSPAAGKGGKVQDAASASHEMATTKQGRLRRGSSDFVCSSVELGMLRSCIHAHQHCQTVCCLDKRLAPLLSVHACSSASVRNWSPFVSISGNSSLMRSFTCRPHHEPMMRSQLMCRSITACMHI